MANIVATNRIQDFTATGATSFACTSWSPPSNNLILATIYSRTSITADPNEPTASGNGLTWVVVNSVVFDNSSSSRRRVTTFRAYGASPSTGQTTFDFGGQSQTGFSCVIDSFTNMDTSGSNGSGAIVQSVTNLDASGTGTTLTGTLAAFSNVNNATYGVFGMGNGNQTTTAGTGFAKVGEYIGSQVEIAGGATTEFRNDNDTSVDLTMSQSAEIGVIAIEIKNATQASSAGTITGLSSVTGVSTMVI